MEFSRRTAANSSSYSYSGSNRSNNNNNKAHAKSGLRNSDPEPTTPIQHTSNSYVATSSTKYAPGPNWKPHKETPVSYKSMKNCNCRLNVFSLPGSIFDYEVIFFTVTSFRCVTMRLFSDSLVFLIPGTGFRVERSK